jgi:hypothetical protein
LVHELLFPEKGTQCTSYDQKTKFSYYILLSP